MTVANVTGTVKGSFEYLLAVEGIKQAFSTDTDNSTWSGLTGGWTVLHGCLARSDLIAQQTLTLASGELSAPGITFRLIDGDSAAARHTITNLMRGLSAATTTYLTATVPTGVGAIPVESVSGFAASGDIYLELETIGYPSTSAGQFDAAVTRGKYGSKSVIHTYDTAAADEVRGDFGLVPEVTDIPVSWYGRRVWLYAAERTSVGLGSAEVIWRGRVTSDLTADGAQWRIPTQSLWDALSTEILAGQAATIAKGIRLEGNVTVDVVCYVIDGGVTIRTSFSVTAGNYTAAGLYAHVTEQLNAAVTAAGPSELYEIAEIGGRMQIRQTNPAGAATYETNLVFRDHSTDYLVLAAAMNAVPGGPEGADGVVPLYLPQFAFADGHFLDRFGPAPEAVVAMYGGSSSTIVVQRADDFAAWDDEDGDYASISLVSINGDPFILTDLSAANDTLTVMPFSPPIGAELAGVFGDEAPRIIRQNVGESPIEIRQGVWIRGGAPVYWKDAFIDHASVPESLKCGLDSADIDWTEISDFLPGGEMSRRDRVLLEPTNFRDLLFEDLRWSGMVPVLVNGTVSARPIANQGLVTIDGSALPAVDTTTLRERSESEMTYGVSRVVNRLEYVASQALSRSHGTQQAFEIRVPYNERQSQGRYRLINSQEIRNTGSAVRFADDVGAYAAGQASSLLAMISRPYPTTRVATLPTMYARVPMDSVTLTHWRLPDASGVRGMTDVLAVVTGVQVDWTAQTVALDLLILTDGAKRSGFAPAGWVISYTDNGAGAGDTRYQLEITPYQYSAVEEGLFFLADMRVELREWDDESAPTSESRIVSPAGHSADGIYVYLTAAPSAGMQTVISAGKCIITLDEYDTAGQTAAAKLYLHVADATDNQLGTSGVTGFVMG